VNETETSAKKEEDRIPTMASIEGLSESFLLNGFRNQTTCPCPELRTPFRDLQSNETMVTDSPTSTPEEDGALWEVLFTCAVLLLSFVALVTDRVGADMVMIVALTLFMASGIVTIKEGLEGFSNEGVLTVMALFPVAEGIAKTGALDWYMSKMLGRPKTIAGAQLRLMVPIAIVSAFMNNTPLVAIMIPIAERWAKNADVPVQQLMMHVSFASILGGTCTLIGTSTNLVVSGLLEARFPDVNVGLFDLAVYGVPNALVGILYCIVASKYLLPEGKGKDPGDNSTEDILLGAKLMPWSPAAGRSVKRSGLRNTGGLYLVSVHRAATGNVHRAVGQEFVLNVGDVLYFTGLVEGFVEFCEEHGMEVLTNDALGPLNSPLTDQTTKSGNSIPLSPLQGSNYKIDPPSMEVGMTKESLMQADEAERSRSITRMIGKLLGKDFTLCCTFRFSFSGTCHSTLNRLDSWCGSRRAHR
jgi:Citrate transporter